MSKRLILANGAFKSGSTWLREIVKNLAAFDPIPVQYADRKYAHWINSGKLKEFAADPAIEGEFLSKSHLYLPSTVRLVLSLEPILVINIKRDIRDVTVSAYYHYKRARKKDHLSFKDYYWSVGRFKAMEVREYNHAWDVDHPRVLLTSYEGLKENFFDEVEKIAGFLGFACNDDIIRRVQEATSIGSLQKQRGEENVPEDKRFFRKGIVGDWKSHFGEEEAADLEKIADNGFRGIDSLKYWVAFPLRRRITSFLKKAKFK